MNERSRLFTIGSWLAVAIMAGVIFWMSANTGSDVNHGMGIISSLKAFLSDTALRLFGHPIDVSPVGHFTEYLIFGALIMNATRLHKPLAIAFVIAIAIGSLYGISDEIHQIFVPDRSCDPADWLVDTIATATGALIVFLFLRTRHPAGSSANDTK